MKSKIKKEQKRSPLLLRAGELGSSPVFTWKPKYCMICTMMRRDCYYMLGLVIILFFWIFMGSILTYMLLGPARLFFPSLSLDSPETAPLGYFLLSHVSFMLLLLGFTLVSSRLIDRDIRYFITAAPSVRISLMFRAGGTWIALMGSIAAAQQLFIPQAAELNFTSREFFLFLPAVLLLTPLQSFSEELLFRSYLWRWFSDKKVLSSPWILCPLSGGVFLLAHLGNPEIHAMGDQFIIYIYYLLYGAFLMGVTLKDRGIEAAVGIHTGNNLFALLILNYDESVLPSPSIWRAAEIQPLYSTAALVTAALLYWLLRSLTQAD